MQDWTTASTDAVTATVTDAVTVAEFNTLDGKTSVGVILTGGVSDAAAAYASTTGTATSGRTAIAAQDGDAALTVTDAATVAQANSVATATTGTVQFSGGITDSTTNLMNGDSSAISTGLSTAKTDDSDVVITANTAVTVAQFNLLDAATSSAIVLSGGISDTAANLAPSGTASSGLTSSTAQDADVAITITGTAPTVAELNKIASLTTGVVTASISGNKTTLAGLTTASDDAITADSYRCGDGSRVQHP